jgi:hypothetical protein
MQSALRLKNKLRYLAARTTVILGNVSVYIRHPSWILIFHKSLGYWPNVFYPQTKNEKFLWRKVFDRNPLYRLVTDKLTVRQFIKMRCPDLLTSDIIWIGASAEQIPDALLQPGVVIKTNNGSSRNIFIGDAVVDRVLVNKQVAEWLTHPYEVGAGEWAYSMIQPYVFIEKLIAAPGDPQFVEICCHVLMGKCVLVTVEKDVKQSNESIAIYDAKANRLPIHAKADAKSDRSRDLAEDFPVPATFEKAVSCAESIARDFDYIRVDFMNAGSRLYFCECTVFPMGGFSIISGEADGWIAAAWDLRNSWLMQRSQRGVRRVYCKLYRYLSVCLTENRSN